MFDRIFALFLRQIYLIRRSPPRLVTYIFWPTIFMLVWGYFNKFLYGQMPNSGFVLSSLLGANLLMCVMERSNINVMMGFLEDVWSRNMGNILISPIRTHELIMALIINAIVATIIGVGSAFIIAYLLFDYNIFILSVSALGFFLNLLITGWAIGLMMVGMIFRFGTSGEYFGWMIAFLITPFVCVYYPVTVLPTAMQALAWCLPPTYVFEALRVLLKTGQFDWTLFYQGLGLNMVWMSVGLMIFVRAMNTARVRGGLLAMSE
jgi:ABC-2 type transport system permease protein